jgi:serine/threonine protein kinase
MHESLTDNILKEGAVKTNSLGPQVFSGNFAYAYEVTSKYRIKYAVRCFRYFSKDREERYIAISNFLKRLRTYYFVDFEYQPEGIIIRGIKYPIVKMAWVDGDLLGQFIADNYSNRRRLKNLIVSLIALARFIEQHNFAHGDIQPGNIIVNNDGKDLKLIDYDGIYVKAISEIGNCECGTPNFQHPKRGNTWNAKLDRFSFISLYVALNALVERYSLWEELACDTESILFVSADYEDTKRSKAFAKIMSIENMRDDVQKFQRICDASFDKVPSLDDFIEGKNVPNYHHTSKLVYFASAIILFMFCTTYFLEHGYTINKIYAKALEVKEFFIGKKTAREVTIEDRYSAGLNLQIKDYADTIRQLDDLHAKLPNDNDITLLAAATYALSGYDDVKLAVLTEGLMEKKIEDSRLYFALSMFYWRKGDIEKADSFMDLALVDTQYMDDKIKKMLSPLQTILKTEINLYNRYKNTEGFDDKSAEIFASAMVLQNGGKASYEYFVESYSHGFTGFSNEYPLDKRSFAEWFDAYLNYNMGKSLKMLIDLHKKYPKNTQLLYLASINIANLYTQGNEGKCYFSRNKYIKVVKEIKYESALLSAQSAVDFAKKLVEISSSQAQSYYALSLAYYANDEFDIAASIANIAKTKITSNDSHEIKEQIDTLLQNINNSISCRLKAQSNMS